MAVICAVFFATHVNVAAFTQNKQRQSGKGNKRNSNLPHSQSLKKSKKRLSRESPKTPV
jgi:hypothetical protein